VTTNRHTVRRPRRGELSSAQREFLLYGPDSRCEGAFANDEEAIAAWERHREKLLACCPIGRRPCA
jgi:hypothetical protein